MHKSQCGENGHWARQCTGRVSDKLISSELAEEMDPCEFPTLEEAASMAGGGKRPTPSVYIGATDAEVEDINMEAAKQFKKIVEPVEAQ